MGYTFRRDLARPLQHAELDANFDHTNLVAIARSLNELDANVGYSTAGLTVKKIVYDAPSQVVYSAPADAIGKTILSIVGSTLNTTEPASYPLLIISSENYDLDITKYGAKEGGIFDCTAAIQLAVNAANGIRWVKIPAGDFLISSTIFSVTGKRIRIKGEGGRSSRIVTTPLFSGYAINATASYDLYGFAVVGNNLDGMYCVGSESGNHGDASAEDLYLQNCEFGMKFDGASEFPLKSQHKRITVYNARTCGIKLGTDSVPLSGQSCASFDNIVVNNAVIPGVPAENLIVTDDFTSTSDKLDWDITGAKEFGWTIMRRPLGSVIETDWVNISQPSQSEITYTATKTAGEYFEYAVQRRSVGIYLEHHKAIDIGVMQCEYVGTGLFLKSIKAGNVGSFYYEWRGKYSSPIPRGDGIYIEISECIDIGTAWTEYTRSAISTFGVDSITINQIIANQCSRSGLYLHQLNNDERYSVTACRVIGGSPKVLYGDPSRRCGEILDVDNTLLDTILDKNISHTADAKYSVSYRGEEKGNIGCNSGGSYLNVNKAAIDPIDKAIVMPLLSSISHTTLTDAVPTDFLTIDTVTNNAGSFMFQYIVRILDGSFVVRQVESGILFINSINVSGVASATVTKSLNSIINQAGTLSDTVFTLSTSGSLITVLATSSSTYTTGSHRIYLTPLSRTGEVTSITQL